MQKIAKYTLGLEKNNIFNDLFIYSWPRSKITNISTNNLIYDSIQLQLEKVNWAISL